MSEETLTPDELAMAAAKSMHEADHKVIDLLGITIGEVKPNEAVCTMFVGDDMVNSHQYCHGGLVYSLADTAFAYACNSTNRASVTLTATISYIAPAKFGDTLSAYAKVVGETGRTGVCEVAVKNQQDKLIARYQGTCYRLNGAVVSGNGN